jgi:hypothetical protein
MVRRGHVTGAGESGVVGEPARGGDPGGRARAWRVAAAETRTPGSWWRGGVRGEGGVGFVWRSGFGFVFRARGGWEEENNRRSGKKKRGCGEIWGWEERWRAGAGGRAETGAASSEISKAPAQVSIVWRPRLRLDEIFVIS